MAIKDHTITRRRAIGGSLASGVVAMTLATASEVDPVIDMAREYFDHKRRYEDIERAFKAGVVSAEKFESISDDILPLMWNAYDRIVEAEAVTVQGVAAQARVLQSEAPHVLQFEDGKEATLLRNLVAALERLGG